MPKRSMQPLEEIRAVETETKKLIEELTRSLIVELSSVFGLFVSDKTIYKHLMALSKKKLLSVDSSIETLAIDFAQLSSGLSKKKSAELLRKTVGVIGTVKEATKTSTDRALQSLSSQIRQMIAEGADTLEIQRALIGTKRLGYVDGLVGKMVKSKELVARTSSVMATNAGRLRKYRDREDVIGYTWVSTFDSATCTRCMAMNGKTFLFEKSGRKYMPPLHINCRCRIQPYYKDHEKNRPIETFKEWADNPKNREQVLEAMGETRYRLYRNGKMKINQFSSVVGMRPLTLEELKKRNREAFKKIGE